MTRFKRVLTAVLLTATAGIGTLLPFSAQASENGRRNTTYGLGALTGALIYKHQWIPAAVSGIGTYAAYHNWQAQVDARHRYQNHLARLNSYRSGYGYGARQASWHQRYVSHYSSSRSYGRLSSRRHYRAVNHRTHRHYRAASHRSRRHCRR